MLQIIKWRQPPPILTLAFRGPDKRIEQAIAEDRLASIAILIGPPGPDGPPGGRGEPGKDGHVPDPGNLILYFENGLT